MKLGFITAPFCRWPLERVARRAKENGFDALEVCCLPAGLEHEDRTFEGSDELVARGSHLARDVLLPHVT